MSTVEVNIVDTSKLRQTSGEMTMTRLAKVYGLDITSPPARRLYDAMTNPGVPGIGDPHEDVPGLFVVSREAAGLGPTHVDVSLQYSTQTTNIPGGQNKSVRYSAGVRSIPVYKDAFGQLIEVSYTNPEGATDKVSGSVTKQVPTLIMTVEKTQGFDPYDAGHTDFVGTVNSSTFRGKSPGFWLCTSVSGNSDDGGNTYRTAYTFEATNEPGGWTGTLFYIPRGDSKPPPDVTTSNGIEDGIALYQKRNFNSLGLF